MKTVFFCLFRKLQQAICQCSKTHNAVVEEGEVLRKRDGPTDDSGAGPPGRWHWLGCGSCPGLSWLAHRTHSRKRIVLPPRWQLGKQGKQEAVAIRCAAASARCSIRTLCLQCAAGCRALHTLRISAMLRHARSLATTRTHQRTSTSTPKDWTGQGGCARPVVRFLGFRARRFVLWRWGASSRGGQPVVLRRGQCDVGWCRCVSRRTTPRPVAGRVHRRNRSSKAAGGSASSCSAASQSSQTLPAGRRTERESQAG